MSYYLYKVLKDKPPHVKSLRESLYWGLVEPFFKEEEENRPPKDVTSERDVYTKIPQAIEMLISFHDSVVVSKKVEVGFVLNKKVYVPTADDFVVFFNVQRRPEDDELKKKLKERRNAKFLEAENFSLQEIYYRIEGRDEFLRKFIADNNFLRSVYEANKDKINLRDDQKQQMDDVYKNLQDWEDLKNTPENLSREKKYKQWSTIFYGKRINRQSSENVNEEEANAGDASSTEKVSEEEITQDDGQQNEVVQDHQQLSGDESEVPKDDVVETEKEEDDKENENQHMNQTENEEESVPEKEVVKEVKATENADETMHMSEENFVAGSATPITVVKPTFDRKDSTEVDMPDSLDELMKNVDTDEITEKYFSNIEQKQRNRETQEPVREKGEKRTPVAQVEKEHAAEREVAYTQTAPSKNKECAQDNSSEKTCPVEMEEEQEKTSTNAMEEDKVERTSAVEMDEEPVRDDKERTTPNNQEDVTERKEAYSTQENEGDKKKEDEMEVVQHTPTCMQNQSFEGPTLDLHLDSPAAPVPSSQIIEQPKADKESDLSETEEQEAEEKAAVGSIIKDTRTIQGRGRGRD
ncbi:uncharacterized protein DDB_G0286299-like [Papaver somniferum]|uniref:uncharacterized protein DDB_G0286299-like n=1 Tax=Papaver somniferum TaxID=3469 RepID=UPI000E6FA1C2|nr:uncharacterized protein DDB_G0286299-like [Papaver somniferum]